jgi:hypothetical protein
LSKLKKFIADHPKINPYRITASSRRLPDFLIIGAAKSGTTSLFHYLSQHPQIKPARKKEIHFFDINYSKGVNWYRAYFPIRKKNQLAFEASASYYCYPDVPQRIHDLIPTVKIIMVVRNPIDRAWSHYWEAVDRGIEKRDFMDTCSNDSPYLEGGHYRKWLDNYLRYFKPSQLYILDHVELTTRFADVFDFLGIENHRIDTSQRYKVGRSDRVMPDEIRIWLEGYYKKLNNNYPLNKSCL